MFLRNLAARSGKIFQHGRSFVKQKAHERWPTINTNTKFAAVVFGSMLGAGSYIAFYSLSKTNAKETRKRKIVVLGSGWGAVNFLKHLESDEFEVAVVSPSNYFLFTPFLPSVTVGTIDGRSTVEPIRKIINKCRHKDVDFFEAECTKVDTEAKLVHCKDTSGTVKFMALFYMAHTTFIVY